MVISDEVYREMAYGPVPKGAYQMGENAVSVSSITKLNGLRGLRVGWLIGPSEVAQQVEAARIYTSYHLPAISCFYAAEAVSRRDWFRERVLRTARENLPTLKRWVEEEGRVSCRMPDGALMAQLHLPPGVDDLARVFGFPDLSSFGALISLFRWNPVADPSFRLTRSRIALA
jgi:aspartate/methionine/tyrosine aminotransferase